MRALTAATIAAMIIATPLVAQTAPSTADAPAAAGQKPSVDPKQTSPGATGAMQNEAAPIATSPQDVRQQQEGKGTAAMPKPGTDIGSAGDKASPGTVGAAPSDDPEKPKN